MRVGMHRPNALVRLVVEFDYFESTKKRNYKQVKIRGIGGLTVVNMYIIK
jgi:hypothetical protein